MPTSSNAVGVCDRDESDVTKARACATGVEDGDDTAGGHEGVQLFGEVGHGVGLRCREEGGNVGWSCVPTSIGVGRRAIISGCGATLWCLGACNGVSGKE